MQAVPVFIAALFALLANAPVYAASVYVANEGAGSLGIIGDPPGNSRTIALDMLPHNVDLTPDGKTLLLVGSAAGHAHEGRDMAMGRLLLLDADQPTQPGQTIELGGHPAHVVTDSDGRVAFVTDAENNALLVIDLASRRVVGRIAVGRYPHGLRRSPDGRMLAIANRDSDDVSLVDPVGRSELARIKVGKRPIQVAFAAHGQRLFVTLNGEDAVAVVDLATRQRIARHAVGDGPVQLVVTADDAQLLVANQGSRQAPGHTLSILDARSGRLLANAEVGKGAHGVAISADGATAYVTNAYEDSVSVVSLKERKEIRRYPSAAGPNGIVAR